jgi:dihydrofolate reductase
MATMRQIVTFNWVTADGYFAGPDGHLQWVVPDPEQVNAAVSAIPCFDTILFGRRTYELFAGFWKDAVDDDLTAPDPHHSGRRTREHGAIGMWLNDATKLVFSRTLTNVTWKNARVLQQVDSREIDAITKQPGRDMMVFGSGSIVSQLTQHALIDEYQFVVCPVLLGSGRPLMDGVSSSLKLDLLEAQKYESGDIMLRYARRTRSSSGDGAAG